MKKVHYFLIGVLMLTITCTVIQGNPGTGGCKYNCFHVGYGNKWFKGGNTNCYDYNKTYGEMMYSYGTPSGTSPAPNGDTTVESEYINCESICDPSPAGPAPQVANGGTFIQNVTIAKLWCVD